MSGESCETKKIRANDFGSGDSAENTIDADVYAEGQRFVASFDRKFDGVHHWFDGLKKLDNF